MQVGYSRLPECMGGPSTDGNTDIDDDDDEVGNEQGVENTGGNMSGDENASGHGNEDEAG